MFPWLMPDTNGSDLSLLSMMGLTPAYDAVRKPWFLQAFNRDDRSDQAPQGNQPDTGNSMAPPGQTPPGGPDNMPMTGYDPSTVLPASAGAPGYGWTPPAWMSALAGGLGGGAAAAGGGNQRTMMNDPRTAVQIGQLGLGMLRPQAAPAPPAPPAYGDNRSAPYNPYPQQSRARSVINPYYGNQAAANLLPMYNMRPF